MPTRRVVTGRSREPRARFAEELRSLRRERGDSLRQLGERLGWDWSLLGKMEKGDTLGGPEVVQALDTYYGTPGLLLAMWEVAVSDKSQFKEQYRRYMSLEAEATSLWHFAVSVLPGLLQTEGYAREVLGASGLKGEALEQQVEARMGRRALLEGKTAPPFRSVLTEAVLRTALRDVAEWRGQLEYLCELVEQGNVTLQVLPFSAGPYGLDSTALMFLRLLNGRTVAYTENAYRGELIEENGPVDRLQRAYDEVRDMALPPAESRKFVLGMLEEDRAIPRSERH